MGNVWKACLLTLDEANMDASCLAELILFRMSHSAPHMNTMRAKCYLSILLHVLLVPRSSCLGSCIMDLQVNPDHRVHFYSLEINGWLGSCCWFSNLCGFKNKTQTLAQRVAQHLICIYSRSTASLFTRDIIMSLQPTLPVQVTDTCSFSAST